MKNWLSMATCNHEIDRPYSWVVGLVDTGTFSSLISESIRTELQRIKLLLGLECPSWMSESECKMKCYVAGFLCSGRLDLAHAQLVLSLLGVFTRVVVGALKISKTFLYFLD